MVTAVSGWQKVAGGLEQALRLVQSALSLGDQSEIAYRHRVVVPLLALEVAPDLQRLHLVRGDMGGAEHTPGAGCGDRSAAPRPALLHRVAEVHMIAAQTRPWDPITRRVRGSIAGFQRDSVIKELSA